jgi:hypothetical protein
MNIKIIHLFMLFTLFAAGTVFGQVDRNIGQSQYKTPKNKAKKTDFVENTSAYYKKELKLDDFQAAVVKEILESERDNIMSMSQDKDMTKGEKIDKVKVINDRIDGKILALLSEEQKIKYKELRKIKDEEAAAEEAKEE